MNVYVFATLDTKGHEADYVRQELKRRGIGVVLVDTGCLGEPQVPADVDRATFFRLGDARLDQLVAQADRGTAVSAAARSAERWVCRARDEGSLVGVFGLGGSAGTTIATAAMRQLPLGVPKVMVSTLAAGDVATVLADLVEADPVLVSGKIFRTVQGRGPVVVADRTDPQPEGYELDLTDGAST
jgi:uncharacterized protein (UPF0261 family)